MSTHLNGNGRVYVSKSRRTVLGMLGLGGVVAVGTETFLVQEADAKTVQTGGGGTSAEQMATALENLAAAIREDKIGVERITIASDIAFNEIVKHELKMSFVHYPEVG